MIVAGIDIGSGKTKAVIMDDEKKVLGSHSTKTLVNFELVARQALDAALADAGLNETDLDYIATSGLGRYSIPFRDIQITDITCAAHGSKFLFPEVECVLDIGAQSTRAIRLRENGKVRQFRTNDRCAAGSGGFLERAAKYLDVPVENIGRLSMMATHPQPISSVCAVLGESEIINHVSNGSSVEDILRGIHDSLADRALSLLRRVGLEGKVAFVGGVARQAGMVKALEEKIEDRVFVTEHPEYVCALGAALLGLQRLQKMNNPTYLQ